MERDFNRDKNLKAVISSQITDHKASCCRVSKHPFALVLGHVASQTAGVPVADVAMVTHAGLLPGVNPHVDLQATPLTEALHALVTPVGLLTGVGAHVDGHLGIVGKNLAT